MVCAVQNVEGRIVGVHRTWLKPDGSGKADLDPQKAMLGACRGGAVRLAKPAATLAVAEGVETGLSVAQACPDLAVWAAMSTSGMKALQVPDIVREIVIFADGDEAGEQAARFLAERCLREGRLARIVRPPQGMDFNDVLNQQGTVA
jgi:phage/plasmid primase-like uncharacterized protein